MQCSASAIASSFDLSSIKNNLFPDGRFFRETLYFSQKSRGETLHFFLFPYGTIVRWGGSAKDDIALHESIQKYTTVLQEIEHDEFSFTYGDQAQVAHDQIVLPDTSIETKLAFSHGISQSVKLGVFESKLQRLFKSTEKIPEEMAAQGKIPLSRSEIRKLMGMLFLERSTINLSLDLLDQPEYFWENSSVEPYYNLISNYLDLKNRVHILNMRLDLVQQIFDMLNSELHHHHSIMIEWTIVILILIEVVLAIWRDFF